MLHQRRGWEAVRQEHGPQGSALAPLAQQDRQRLYRDKVQQTAEGAALLHAGIDWEGWGVVAIQRHAGGGASQQYAHPAY